MPAWIKMPKLSDTMTEGTVVKWLKQEGDAVAIDEEIAEVETDKATMAMPCFEEGVIHKIYVPEGSAAPLGAVLALVLEEGEDPPADVDNPPQPEKVEKTEKEDKKSGDAKSSGTTASPKPNRTSKQKSSAASSGGERVKASPLARKLAEEQGIDLGKVRGTGPGGRIVKDDLNFVGGGGGGVFGGSLGLLPAPNSEEDESIQLSGMRRVIAERLLESKTTIPHFYLNIEVDTEPMMTLRSQVNEASLANGGPKYTVNDFIMRAVVLATQAVPQVNASFQGDSVYQYGDVDLSVAVAVDDGLVTPVIREAQTKSMRDLADEIKDLASRARDKKLTPEEMQGGTITISNLGGYGIVSFDAIINPPQAAILSIGTITKQPVVNAQGQIVPGQRMWIGMSCDHRVIDGAVGAQFLAQLKRFVETPVLLIS